MKTANLSFYLIAILFVFCLQTNAQESLVPIKKKSKLSIGFNIMPTYSYRSMRINSNISKTDPNYSRNQSILNYNEASDRPKMGLSTGLSFLYSAFDRLSFQTGIQFTERGYNAKYVISPQPNESPNLHTKYQSYFIDIPLKFNYTIIKKSALQFYAGLGSSLNLNIKTRSVATRYFNGDDIKYKIISKGLAQDNNTISAIANIGMDTKIGKSLNLRVEPTFRYALTEYSNTPITGNFWDLGINFNFVKHLFRK